MRRVLCALAVVVTGAFASTRACADVTYQYVTDQSTYTANAGGSVTIKLYLNETVTSATSTTGAQNSSIIFNDGGLVGAGVYVVAKSGGNGATINTAAGNIQATGNTGNAFDTSVFAKTDGVQAGVKEVNNSAQNTFGNTNGSTVSSTTTYQIFLGTLTITAGSSAGQTNYSVLSFFNAPKSFSGANQSNGNTVTAGTNASFNNAFGIDLDVSHNANLNGGPPPDYIGAGDTQNNGGAWVFSVTTSAAPEPSSMLLCGLAVCGGAFTAYRRRKAREAAAAESAAA
jgi:hypothetical protein